MKKYFITGLVILLPLAVTIAIVVFVVNFLTTPFLGLVTNILQPFSKIAPIWLHWATSPEALKLLSQLIILIGLFFLVVLLGFLARLFLFNALLRFSDYIMKRIPLINKVYNATQEVIKTLFYSPTKSFSKVVLVPFPSGHTYSLGLVSGDALKVCNDALQAKLISVFVPTTPNPTSGYLMMYKPEDIIYLDMKVEDAFKYVISCGVLGNEPTATAPIETKSESNVIQL